MAEGKHSLKMGWKDCRKQWFLTKCPLNDKSINTGTPELSNSYPCQWSVIKRKSACMFCNFDIKLILNAVSKSNVHRHPNYTFLRVPQDNLPLLATNTHYTKLLFNWGPTKNRPAPAHSQCQLCDSLCCLFTPYLKLLMMFNRVWQLIKHSLQVGL